MAHSAVSWAALNNVRINLYICLCSGLYLSQSEGTPSRWNYIKLKFSTKYSHTTYIICKILSNAGVWYNFSFNNTYRQWTKFLIKNFKYRTCFSIFDVVINSQGYTFNSILQVRLRHGGVINIYCRARTRLFKGSKFSK